MSTWIDQPLEELAQRSPLAQVRPASELAGVLRKRLAAPPDRAAVVAPPGGPPRVLPPGQTQTVGTLWDRFTGRLGRTVYALLPAGTLHTLLTARRLGDPEAANRFYLSGDGQLLDLTVHAPLRISQPALFFEQLLRPRGRLDQLSFEAALAQQVAPALGAALASELESRAAGDLAHPAVRAVLAQVASRALAAPLAGWGLELAGAGSVVARPAEATVAVAERVEALQAQLREVAQAAEMDKLTRAAELHEYAQQLEADFGVTGLAQAAEAETPDRAPDDHSGLLAWLQRVTERLVASRVAGDLARRAPQLPKPATVVEVEPVWLRWMTPLRYIFSLAMIVLILLSFWRMSPDHPDYGGTLLRLLLYSGVLVLGLISSIWAEERTRRRLLSHQVMGSLALLSAGDRIQADRILRRQVTTELDAIQDKLKEARFKWFRAGDKEAAADLKEIERRVERQARELGIVDVGLVPYMTRAYITPRQLDAMLNYDDDLLLQSNALGDRGQAILSAAIRQEPAGEVLPDLEAALAEFEHHFKARARYLRTPLPETSSDHA